MSKENGKGMIKALIALIIILCVIGLIIKSINTNINEQKNDKIMSDMLLIKGACKVLNENKLRTNSEDALIGTVVSNIKIQEEENENQKTEESDYNIIEEFKKLQIISEEEYAKYYVLTDEDLQKLKVEVKNQKDSYYLINYETNEVIITKGHEGKYKLSDIEKDEEENKEENASEEKNEQTSNNENEKSE